MQVVCSYHEYGIPVDDLEPLKMWKYIGDGIVARVSNDTLPSTSAGLLLVASLPDDMTLHSSKQRCMRLMRRPDSAVVTTATATACLLAFQLLLSLLLPGISRPLLGVDQEVPC